MHEFYDRALKTSTLRFIVHECLEMYSKEQDLICSVEFENSDVTMLTAAIHLNDTNSLRRHVSLAV